MKATAGFPFLELPSEIQVVTLQLIHPLDVVNVGSTCKELFQLCKDEAIWKHHALQMVGEVDHNPASWRRYFYHRAMFLTKNTMEWKQKESMMRSSIPSPRQSLSGSYINGKLVFIGGQTSVKDRFDDIYYYEVDKKVFYKPALRSAGPPKFARHAAVEVGKKIYVFGGFDGFGTFFGLGIYDTDTHIWSYPKVHGKLPIPRTNHTLAAVGTKVYLFGGNDTTKLDDERKAHPHYGTYGDFQVFDTITMTWSDPVTSGPTPCPRSGHHMLSIGKHLYIFGGGLWNDFNKSWIQKYDDMYSFDTETGQWRLLSQNGQHPQFISLPHWKVGDFIFVFYDPLWCFDTVTCTWQALKVKGAKPLKRFLGSAVSSPDKCSAFMFGGVYTTVLNNFDQLAWPPSITEALMLKAYQDKEQARIEQPVSSN